MNADPKYSEEQKKVLADGHFQAIRFLISHNRIDRSYLTDLIHADMEHVEATGYSMAPPF